MFARICSCGGCEILFVKVTLVAFRVREGSVVRDATSGVCDVSGSDVGLLSGAGCADEKKRKRLVSRTCRVVSAGGQQIR